MDVGEERKGKKNIWRVSTSDQPHIKRALTLLVCLSQSKSESIFLNGVTLRHQMYMAKWYFTDLMELANDFDLNANVLWFAKLK